MKVWVTNSLNTHLARKLARRWRDRPVAALDAAKIDRVLLVELGGLGDAVNLLPVLDALRERFPSARITVVCRDYVRGLFELTTGLEHLIGIDKSRDGLSRAVSALGDTEWGIVISTCWSTWTTALALKLQAKALTGFWRPWRVESFGFNPATAITVSRGDHLSLLRFKAVAPLGLPMPNTPPFPKLTPRDSDWKSALRKHQKLGSDFVALIPFCGDRSKSLIREESRLAFRELQKLNLPVILVGGKSESGQMVELAEGETERVIDNLTIPELAAALAHARVVVSVDTGAMHLASAVGTPTVGIFKSTDPRKCGPRGDRVLTIAPQDFSEQKWRQAAVGWLK